MTEPTPDRPASREAGAATPAAPEPAVLTPVAAAERVEILDVLRGFAIFGILLVNMALFFSPMHLQVLNEPVVGGALDELARELIMLVAQGKFYSLFSFLFGLGLAIQMERAAARGRTVGGFFTRRMFWLLLIGLAHAFLFWFGDILVIYSLMGFLLVLFRNAKLKTLGIWTAVLFAIPILVGLGNFGYITMLKNSGPEIAELANQGLRQFREGIEAGVQPTYQAYSTGSFGEIMATRAAEWWLIFPFTMFNFAWVVLGLFVLGLNFGKRRFFERLEENAPAIRRWILPLWLIGLALNVAMVWISGRVEPMAPSLPAVAYSSLFVVGPPVLSAAYVATICLLWLRPGGRRLLHPLAPVGRMALTNYLMHSVVFTTVAYSYGLGLYGKVGYLEGLGLTVLMYALQIPLSAWWLRRFRFGPMEWLWRTLSYGRVQPMRRQA